MIVNATWQCICGHTNVYTAELIQVCRLCGVKINYDIMEECLREMP